MTEHETNTALALPTHPGVEAFWEMTATGGAHRVLPDGCMDLLFDLDAGRARIVGTMSRAHVVQLEAGTRYFGVRFRPGAAPHFVGLSGAEMRDDEAPLSDVMLGGAALEERVLGAASHRERRAQCVAYLQRTRVAALPLDRRVAAAVQQFERADGCMAVSRVAEQVGVSERQLERLFDLHVGLRPKLFARVVRLQAALRLSHESSVQAWISAAAGYADEPHLLREFRALAGCSLSQLRRERDVGIVQDQLQAWD